jgi:hypothetical protein
MKISANMNTSKTIFTLLISLLIQNFAFSNSVGSKPEVTKIRKISEAAFTRPQATQTVASGQRIQIPSLPSNSSAGRRLTYFWSCEGGLLEAGSLSANSVYYTAPAVSLAQTESLYYAITSSSGKMEEGNVLVTVTPSSSAPAYAVGQLSGIYNTATANFSLTYTLGATVTSGWLLSSADGVTYSVASTIAPVTATNRSGTRTVTVAGSGSRSQVWFRLRTQVGTAAAVDGTPFSVAYTPPPAAPKSTEIPAAPNLIINGSVVSMPQVQLMWQRVNDSNHRDNVVRYEVQQDTNPAFTSASISDVGNSAAGQNIYESVLYTASSLLDNTTYYFRVRAINNAGTGPWSASDSISVSVQDFPQFAATPVAPPNGATGVVKLPSLEFTCQDADGDELDYYIYYGTTPTDVNYRVRGFGDANWKGSQRLDPSEWNSALVPNRHYYWRVEAREAGRDKAYYGGNYPSSPVWDFVTVNSGSALSFSNVTLTSGVVKPGGELTYQMTLTNSGDETAQNDYVVANYVKNGAESLFKAMDWSATPVLTPGASVGVTVKLRFRTDIFISPEGVSYDNVLVPGNSAIRFYMLYNDQSIGAASFTLPITYIDAGGPVFSSFFLSNDDGGNRGGVPRGGVMNINASILDDVRTTRALIEYRIDRQAPWVALDDYTGNTTQSMRFGSSIHSGPTVSILTSGGTIKWSIPNSFPLTSTLELRITAFDNQGNSTVGLAPPMRIYDDTIIVNAGACEFSRYRLGDRVTFPLSVTTPMLVNYYDVVFKSSQGGRTKTLLSVSKNGDDPLVVPSTVSVNLPTSSLMVTETGIIEVSVAASSGVGGRNVSDTVDTTIVLEQNELPSPFHRAIAIPNSGSGFTFPPASTGRDTWINPISLDWDGESSLHLLAQEQNSYVLDGVPVYASPLNFWVRYDRNADSFQTGPLPSGYECNQVIVSNSVPYVLHTQGNAAYFSVGGGGGAFSPPILLENHTLLYGDEHSLVRFGSELFYSYIANREQPSTNRRNRIKRIRPSVAGAIEHPNTFYGSRPTYGDYLNAKQGIFTLNPDLSIGTGVASWDTSSNAGYFTFSSYNSPVIGANMIYDGQYGLFTYSVSGIGQRWSTPFSNAYLKSFANYSLAVGSTVPGRPDSNSTVIIRRSNTSGSEEALQVGRSGDNAFRTSSISNGGLVGLSWSTGKLFLAIGNMSGDITAPTAQITSADTSFTTGQPKSFTWAMADNLNQIASVKVLKVVGGVSTTIGNYTSGPFPTTFSYSFPDTASRLIFRLEVTDASGNRGVAEQVLSRAVSFTLDSFTAAGYSVPMGTAASLSWVATPADPFRVYQILTRSQGTTAWSVAGSVTGTSYLLDTSLLSGANEVRLQSGALTRDLPQAITVTGNRFAFDTAAFTPGTGTAYVASGNPLLTLGWGSNQPESVATAYTVLGQWNGTGSFVVLGGNFTKSLEVNAAAYTSIVWKVVANWEGQEYASGTRTVTIGRVAGGPLPVATAGGLAASAPWVDLSWTAVPGADEVIIFRKGTLSDTVEELARVAGTDISYKDTAVGFGDRFSYTLATRLGTTISPQGAAAAVTLDPVLPLGITFVNPNNQARPSNANTVQWNPTLPAGATEVYQNYQVLLRKGDGAIVQTQILQPTTVPAQVAYTGLDYNQSYVVEVFARRPDGNRLSEQPVKLNFTTGFDARAAIAAGGPAATVDAYGVNLLWTPTATADTYEIHRSINGAAFTWFANSFFEGYADGSVPIGASVRYFIRSRNDNGFADSPPSAAVTAGTAFQAWAAAAGLTVDDSLAAGDSDLDGVSNLLEYGFGTNPTLRSSFHRPQVATAVAGSMDFTFTRLSARTDLTYEVQTSTDLQQWTPVARSTAGGATQSLGAPVQSVTDAGGATPSVRVRLAVAVGTLKRYMRLQVVGQ